MFVVLSCDKSLREFSSSSNEWRTLPTHRPSQPTRAVSPPVGCYCLHPPLSFIITQPENWLYFTISHFNQSTTLLFMFFYHLTLQPINNSLVHVLLPSHTSTNQQLSCSCSYLNLALQVWAELEVVGEFLVPPALWLTLSVVRCTVEIPSHGSQQMYTVNHKNMPLCFRL